MWLVRTPHIAGFGSLSMQATATHTVLVKKCDRLAQNNYWLQTVGVPALT